MTHKSDTQGFRPARRGHERILWVGVFLLVMGCSRSPRLADGPIDVKQQPTVIQFETPVRPTGPTWEMCFEFANPGDSRHAGRIHTVLISTTGGRYTPSDAKLDRRGEAMVCQVGRVIGVPPVAEGTVHVDSIVYEAVELSSDVSLRLRSIRGGSRPR